MTDSGHAHQHHHSSHSSHPSAVASASSHSASTSQQHASQMHDPNSNAHHQSSQSHSSSSSGQPPASDGSGSSSTNTVASSSKSSIHSFMVYDSKFIIDSRYVPLKPLGRGAYGVVCSAMDKVTGRKVAIKKIHRAFDDLIDAKRILREVKLLRHFRHENIIGLRDLAGPADIATAFDDIYIVLDFMETDLHKIIYSKNELTDEHIQYFIYQILKALKFIHSAQVIHRDLKPSNLLLNGNCDLKICDFGLARGVKDQAAVDYELTEYVVTRWYRAPEVMCSCQEYDSKIDTWSVGCIMGELLGRKPLFPGDDYIKQMNLIFDTLGTPSSADLAFISNDKALEYIKGLKKKAKKPFATIYPKASPQALDLLEKMLVFNPHNRVTIDDALAHPYLKALHNVKTEPNSKSAFNFDFEKCELSKAVIQDLMWEEILNFRSELRHRGFRRSKEDPTIVTPFANNESLEQYIPKHSAAYPSHNPANGN